VKRLIFCVFAATIATLAHAECDSNVEANESLASIKERLGCFARELAALRAEVDILRNIETENENLRAQLDAFRKGASGEAVLRVTKVWRDLDSYSFPEVRARAVSEMQKRNAKVVREGNQWIDFEMNNFPVMLACRTHRGTTCDVTVVGPGPDEDVNIRVANWLRDSIFQPAK